MDWGWTSIAATIAACASALAAIVASIISGYQIHLSNKQNLFERRLSIWLVVDGLLNLYGRHHNLLKREADPQLDLPDIFLWLTNNTYLCDIGNAAAHPLVSEYQRPFLEKLDEMKSLSSEAIFVFKGYPAKVIAGFLSNYQQLLFSIYQHQVLMSRIDQNAHEFQQTLEQACNEMGESEKREELYRVYDAIGQAYIKINDPKMMKTIEKQIRLTRLG